MFKIDHDNGSVKYFLSHFLDRYEPYINQDLIYRHRATTSINYKPLYCSIVFISLVQVPVIVSEIPNKYFLQTRPPESAISAQESSSYTSSWLNVIQRWQ